MTSWLDRLRNNRDAASKERDEHILPASFLEKTEEDATASIEDGRVLLAHDISQLTFQGNDLGQEPQLVGLDTIPQPSPAFHLRTINGQSNDDLATWIFPAINNPKSTEKSKIQTLGVHEYTSFIHNFIKNIGIYALASIMAPLSGLILVPFLTRSLSHNDYGALAVLITALALMDGITQLGLLGAFLRAYGYDYESEHDRKGVISMVVLILLLTSVLSAIITVMNAPWLAQLLFNDASHSDAVRIAGFLLPFQSLSLPGYALLRAQNRAVAYTIVSVLQLLVNLGATVVLVGVLHMGINGALLATGCGYLWVIISTLPDIRKGIDLRLRFDIARDLLSFGLPLVPNFISLWILQLSDRFLLGRIASLDETAKYTVAYTLGGILGVVVLSPFARAWPTAMYTITKRNDASRIFQVVFRWYSLLLLFATGGLLFISTGTLYILFPPSYYSAAPIMPIVAVSIVFYGLYSLFTVGASLRRKNWFLFLFALLSALLNVGANLILIPLYGSMGAAISTFIAYAFLALVTYVLNQRIYPIPFEVGMFCIALCIGTALYVGCRFLTQDQGIYTTCAVYVCAFVLYSGCLIVLGKLRK